MREKIKKFVIAVMCLSIWASLGTYVMMNRKQHYVSSVNIKFANAGAENGTATDGSLIKDDIEMVKNVEVLDAAIRDADLQGEVTANNLSTHIKVESVIPQDEQNKIDSALDNGKEYEYNPVEYKITLTSEIPTSARLLNSIAKCFIQKYADDHVVQDSYPSDTANTLDDKNYDYIECADILKQNIDSMMAFLTERSDVDNDYHSTATGYSFSDFYGKYNRILETEMPDLYAMILSNKASKDPQLLVQKLELNNDKYKSSSADTSEDLAKLKELIKSYSEKNKASGTVQKGDKGDEVDDNRTNIIQDVYDNASRPKSSYDSIFATYNTENDLIATNTVGITYNEYLINTFKDAKKLDNSSLANEITDKIEQISAEMHKLYTQVSITRSEFAEICSANDIVQVNTAVAAPQVSVKMYTLLAFTAVFLMLGVGIPALLALRQNFKRDAPGGC